MQGTRGMGKCYIPGNVLKHSAECCQTFRGMSPNIPGNVLKYSGECRLTFQGMSPMFRVNEENYWTESYLESC